MSLCHLTTQLAQLPYSDYTNLFMLLARLIIRNALLVIFSYIQLFSYIFVYAHIERANVL